MGAHQMLAITVVAFSVSLLSWIQKEGGGASVVKRAADLSTSFSSFSFAVMLPHPLIGDLNDPRTKNSLAVGGNYIWELSVIIFNLRQSSIRYTRKKEKNNNL